MCVLVFWDIDSAAATASLYVSTPGSVGSSPPQKSRMTVIESNASIPDPVSMGASNDNHKVLSASRMYHPTVASASI
jgi:hypothetical protein